jgi:sugar phosphate isomerase/epimerase
MKLAMMSACALPMQGQTEADIAELCAFTRAIGLEAIDFITDHGVAPATLRKVTGDSGLTVCAYTFFAPLNFPTPEERQPGLDEVKRGIEAAVTLGTDKVMIPPAGRDDLSRTESRRNWIAGLNEALPIARDAGIALTIEDFGMGSSPFVTSSDLLAAVDGVPGLKLTFDNGNCFTGGEDPVAAWRAVREHTVHVHFKSFYLAERPDEGFLAIDGRHYVSAVIGRGLVDNAASVAALKKDGYEGYINLEAGEDGVEPREAIRLSAEYLTALM